MPDPIALDEDRLLLLKNRRLTQRLRTLFSDLDADEELQRAFIQSPVEVLGLEVTGLELDRSQAAAVNRFVFAALSNEEFRSWAESYDREHGERSREEVLRDFSEALARTGDPALMRGLLTMLDSGVRLEDPLVETVIVKAESIAIGNWFIYKVSGHDDFDDLIVSPEQFQRISQQLVFRAQELSAGGEL
ncbi:hypothetical protein [Microbispora sp. NBC_01389]|uniref:hypothetical protein n=1 Tax=Microbispora sp. NBC_01389 TaxID=2903584 RepID=UPI00324913C5